jgi:biotin operon repressor
MEAVKRVESDAVRSVQGLVDALADARVAFREVEQSFQKALKKADRSGDVESALLSPQLGVLRQSVNDAIDEIERQRREMRMKLFALARSEDYSIGELGRMFGFSRQLASKYANEVGDRRR